MVSPHHNQVDTSGPCAASGRFTVSLLNCRGLGSKDPDTIFSLFVSTCDVFVLTETKLDSHSKLACPDGFEAFSKPAVRLRGGRGISGGIAIFHRMAAHRTACQWRIRPNCLWIRLDGVLSNGPLFLCAVYLPPGDHNRHFDQTFWSTFESDVSDASRLGTALVLGDFNARIGCHLDADPAAYDPTFLESSSGIPGASSLLPPRKSCDKMSNSRMEPFLSCLQASALVVANGRVAGNSGMVPTSRGNGDDGLSVVDYLLVPVALLSSISSLHVEVVDTALSDHNALHAVLEGPALAGGPMVSFVSSESIPLDSVVSGSRVHYRLPRDGVGWSRLSLAMRARFELRRAFGRHSPPTVDEACSDLITDITDTLDRLCRRRCHLRPSSRRSLPWYTPALAKLAAAVRRCAARVHACPGGHPGRPAARSALAQARAQYRKARRSAEMQWQVSSASSFVDLAKTHPKRFWQSIFDDRLPQPTASPASLTDYFEALLNPQAPPIDIDSIAPVRSGAPSRSLSSLASPFTICEVRQALKDLKSGRAGDCFGMKAEVLKCLGREDDPHALDSLCSLFNRFLLEGFPAQLSTSVLLPIYKGKGDLSDPNNFRGISIVPLLSKLYALLLNNRLSPALEVNRLRADSQYGFRRHRGTVEAAFVLRAVLDSSRRPSGTERVPLYGVFVDFKKAFDMVSRPLLWRLMHNLGLPAPFVAAVESYYMQVNFQVETPSGLGPRVSASQGVKQGCPLSPTLFGIFIEALLERFLHTVDPTACDFPLLAAVPTPPLLYADDLALLSTSLRGAQLQLGHLALVASEFGMIINVEKTKAMAFHVTSPRLEFLRRSHPLQLSNQSVEWVEEFRYLGLIVHFQDGFSRAARVLYTAAMARYHAMWRQCRSRGVQDAASLSLLFDSLVTTILGYGAPIWGPDVFFPSPDVNGVMPFLDAPCSSLALEFEKLQRRFMRSVLGLPQRTSHVALHIETQRPPLSLVFYQYTCRFLERLMAHSEGSLLWRALTACASYTCSQTSWLAKFQAWSSSLGVSFDLSAFVPLGDDAPSSRPLTRSAAQASERRAPPPSVEASQLAYSCWHAQLHPRVLSLSPPLQARFTELSAGPVPWSRRLPVFYNAVPLLRDRGILASSRLFQPVRGLDIFHDPSSDLRSLDPDPSSKLRLHFLPPPEVDPFSSDIHLLALQHSLDPSLPLSTLLSSPPPSLLPFLHDLSRYIHLRLSASPRPDILRLLPGLLPTPSS